MINPLKHLGTIWKFHSVNIDQTESFNHVHFLVSVIVCVEEYPIRWYHSSRSFIFWESFNGRLLSNGGVFVFFVGGAFVISVGVDTVVASIGAIRLLLTILLMAWGLRDVHEFVRC